MTKDEALKLALEALEEINKLSIGANAVCLPAEIDTAMDALREALAEQKSGIKQVIELYDSPDQPAQQEPVAWVSSEELLVMRGNALGGAKDWRINVGLVKQENDVGLYTTPPQRTWVGLTDEEVMELAFNFDVPSLIVRTVEAKLKEKNT